MYLQQTLFDLQPHPHIVHTASIPHRSPFRYPGGKTWLIPHIRRWLSPIHPQQLIEPFVGGGIVSLTALAEEFVRHITIVEKDEDVGAVWSTILDLESHQWLMDKLISFEVNYDNVISFLGKTSLSHQELVFRTILRNRVNRGGILAAGAGLLKNGENGKGLTSRWYPKTLKKRIHDIAVMSEHITFIQGDGMDVMRDHMQDPDSVFFIDPPYTAAGKKAGKRLYTHSELDHRELFSMASRLQGDFLMTYDDTEEIRELVRQFGFDLACVPMRNTHHAELSELLIGPNLRWCR